MLSNISCIGRAYVVHAVMESTGESNEIRTEDGDESLFKFLKDRGLDEMKIEEIKVQKIDCEALLLMDDDEMKKYIPAFGDRLAVVAYCKKKQGQRISHSVLDKLKKKLNRKRGARVNSDSYVNASITKSSKTEERQTIEYKRIELGWKHFDSECKQYKQVRSQNGGGCRQLRVSVVWGKDDIIKEGKSLFFHKGKSSKGYVNDLLFTVQDFRNVEMGNETIEDVYKATCVKLLRLYICTKSHVDTMSDEEEIVMGKSSGPSTTLELDETLPEPKNTSSPLNLNSAHMDNSDISEVIEVIDDVEHANCPQEVMTSAIEPPTEEIYVSGLDLDLGASTVATEPAVHDVRETCEEAVTLYLNRVNIQAEMVAHFKTPEIITTPLKINFKNEAGADAQGVSRDAYTCFWNMFFESSADGEDVRVPAINPHYGLEEWQAIGRILVKGFLDVKVFPVQLAPVFFGALMFGEEALSPDDLFDSFMLYLSDSDRKVISSALHDEVMSEENMEAFEDILDREGSHNIPSKDQIQFTVQQLARKCLVQNGSYALEAMRTVVQSPLRKLFPSMTSIKTMYSNLKPNVKKVCDLLQAEPQNKQEDTALRLLKQYIKSRNDKGLADLLHFLTGSSVLSVSKIGVAFTSSSGFGRTPVVHTCGPTLELPSTYTAYREFRSEWDAMLASGYLKMDIA